MSDFAEVEKELITLPDGREAWRYANGFMRDAKTGHIIRPADHQICRTAERSQELRERWTDQKNAAIEAGLAAASMDSPAKTIELIVKKRAEVAMSDDGRPGNEAARLIFQLSNVLAQDGLQNDGIDIKIRGNAARDLLNAIVSVKSRRIAN